MVNDKKVSRYVAFTNRKKLAGYVIKKIWIKPIWWELVKELVSYLDSVGSGKDSLEREKSFMKYFLDRIRSRGDYGKEK